MPGELSLTRRGFQTGIVTAAPAIPIKGWKGKKLPGAKTGQEVGKTDGCAPRSDFVFLRVFALACRKGPAYLIPSTATLKWMGYPENGGVCLGNDVSETFDTDGDGSQGISLGRAWSRKSLRVLSRRKKTSCCCPGLISLSGRDKRLAELGRWGGEK